MKTFGGWIEFKHGNGIENKNQRRWLRTLEVKWNRQTNPQNSLELGVVFGL